MNKQTVTAKVSNKVLKRFRDTVYKKTGLKKGSVSKELEQAMLEYVMKYSAPTIEQNRMADTAKDTTMAPQISDFADHLADELKQQMSEEVDSAVVSVVEHYLVDNYWMLRGSYILDQRRITLQYFGPY